MDQLVSLYALKDEVLKQIDKYEWKHSWHLPTTYNGYIDWSDEKTHNECKNILESHLRSAKATVERCERLLKSINWKPCRE